MTSFGVGGTHALSGGANAKGEFRDMIMEILDGAIGSTFCQCCENVVKTKQNGGHPIPPIPLETLVVLALALKSVTHGARISLCA